MLWWSGRARHSRDSGLWRSGFPSICIGDGRRAESEDSRSTLKKQTTKDTKAHKANLSACDPCVVARKRRSSIQKQQIPCPITLRSQPGLLGDPDQKRGSILVDLSR